MVMNNLLRVCLLLIFASSASGCFWVTTKAEGNKLKTKLGDVDNRLENQEQGLEKKVKLLQEVIDQATALLKRNSANIGDEVKELDNDIRQLRGLLTAAKRYTDDVKKETVVLQKQLEDKQGVVDLRLADLDKRLAAVEEKTTKPVAQTATELYTAGKAAFDAGDYDTARDHFKRLVIKFPGHDRADDAQYFRGEAHFREKDYDGAIREFQKLFDKFAKSPMADDAWYRAGEAATALKRCTEARAYFGELRRRHPKSALASKANSRIKELKKAEKDPKKCLR